MKLAHGFIYSRRWNAIEAYWKGQHLLSGDPRTVLRDEQSRGEFRYRIALLLIDRGINHDLAAEFACFSKWPRELSSREEYRA